MWHAKEVCLRSQHVYANTLFSINGNLLGVFTFSLSVNLKLAVVCSFSVVILVKK